MDDDDELGKRWFQLHSPVFGSGPGRPGLELPDTLTTSVCTGSDGLRRNHNSTCERAVLIKMDDADENKRRVVVTGQKTGFGKRLPASLVFGICLRVQRLL